LNLPLELLVRLSYERLAPLSQLTPLQHLGTQDTHSCQLTSITELTISELEHSITAVLL
jgi:hypothetical protein